MQFFDHGWHNVNFELGTRGFKKIELFSFESCMEASFASQTQPTPAGIGFRLLRTGVGWVRVTKTYPRWGWLGLACETTLCERLSCLQRHLGGQYWRTTTIPMWEWLLCLPWWLSRGYFRLYRVEWEVLVPFSFSAFYTSLFTSSAITRGIAWERGPCRSRTQSMRCKLQKEP